MLRRTVGMRLLGDARYLPLQTGSVDAVAALWMLYHLDDPGEAVAEAWRVLRPGGWFFASASSRFNDRELVDRYPSTSFDAEEAADIVGAHLSVVDVVAWDAPLTVLADHEAITRSCIHHFLGPAVGRRIVEQVGEP